jgi:hypothetical protein
LTGYIPPQSIPGSTVGKKKKKKKKSSGGAGGIAGGLLAGLGGFSGLTGGLAPSGPAASLSEAIEQQAANQQRQAEQKALENNPALANPFMALQDQLYGAVNSINVAPTPLDELRRMAEQQAGAQFDPVIAALKNEMGVHSERANRSAKTAREMYGALAKDYLSQLPEMTQQFAAEDQQTNQRYDQAQQQMGADYQKNASQQDALLKQLGIQAASPDASQQSRDDQAYFQNQMESDQQSALSALNEQQAAQQNYQQNLGSNAKMAGANLSSDIGQELSDYLGGAESQMTQLRGQRGSTVAALLAQLQQQDSERVAQQRQQEFDNQMKLFNFQLDTTNSAMKNAPGAVSGTGFGADGTLTTGLAGANNYLASQYPDQPILASNLMEQLNNVLQNKDVVNGKFVLDPGNPEMGQSPKYSDVGQEYMMDLLKREFEQEGDRYGTGDINSTMNALLAYLGKLR